MPLCEQLNAPPHSTSEGVGESYIGLRIIIVPNPAVLYLTPPQNRLGTYSVCRLLRLALELAGIRVSEAMSSLAFNRSYYLFRVSKLGPALKVLKEEVENLAMVDYSELAWRDEREGVWRRWPAQTGAFHAPSPAELAAEGDFLNRITEELNNTKNYDPA